MSRKDGGCIISFNRRRDLATVARPITGRRTTYKLKFKTMNRLIEWAYNNADTMGIFNHEIAFGFGSINGLLPYLRWPR